MSPTFLLPLTRRSLPFTSSLLHFVSSSCASPISNRIQFLISSKSRDLERSLRLHYPDLLISHEHESVPNWGEPKDLQEALNVCDGVILAASGSGDDCFNVPSDLTEEWLQCEQNVTSLVSEAHRVVKLSWMEGFVSAQSPLAVGRATWEIEQELKSRLGGGDASAHNLTIVRAPTGMDAFLRGRLFDLVCGRTLSISIKHGRVAFVHPSDVAETLSALVVKEDTGVADAGRLFKLTGPESLTFPDVAELLSEGIGEKVNYSYFPLWAVQPARWVHGVPGDAIEEELAVIRALEAGTQQAVDTTLMETLLGRKPRSFCAFIAENAAAWPRTDPK
uniref:NAD(P)-binding domain-containing protein n=2 Tax=Hyaloperonospora arabidopsidis (strain Emoy2) TaxID=559515 RepID=M4C637_HYAAE